MKPNPICRAPIGHAWALALGVAALGLGMPSLLSSADSPAGPSSSGGKSKGKGTLYRFGSDGRPERLYDSDDEHFTSLALGDDGRPYVGTGVEGRVYSVDEAHRVALVADIDERQVGALVLAGPQQVVLGSDPAVVHPVRGVGGPDAVWTSKVLDAGLRARFGRMSWEATGAIDVSTRTGNTRFKRDLNWQPQFPSYREGLSEIVR